MRYRQHRTTWYQDKLLAYLDCYQRLVENCDLRSRTQRQVLWTFHFQDDSLLDLVGRCFWLFRQRSRWVLIFETRGHELAGALGKKIEVNMWKTWNCQPSNSPSVSFHRNKQNFVLCHLMQLLVPSNRNTQNICAARFFPTMPTHQTAQNFHLHHKLSQKTEQKSKLFYFPFSRLFCEHFRWEQRQQLNDQFMFKQPGIDAKQVFFIHKHDQFD